MENPSLTPEIQAMIAKSNAARAAGGLAAAEQARTDTILDHAGTPGMSASGHQELADDGLIVFKPPELLAARDAARRAAANVEPMAQSTPVGVPSDGQFVRRLLAAEPNGRF